ncbi:MULTISPECIES: hypothetical protein [unclassified Amycolatopsis]|uniref:hypothetical protein n=1 Tax=unclassified Amycolatopsis TaxID=2618356 RepID=UPI002E0EE035|nr:MULTISPECIES: hypothetical protein [unclassified Amycolatopsis]WSK83049.1 hypothetical protein OG570_21760 [Amycolatopsis sp. NBC_01286]
MSGFVTAALAFPAVLFSFLLIVVIGYWVLALVGVLDVEDGEIGFFGGVPLPIPLSLLVAFSWFLSLVGTVLIDGVGTPLRVGLGFGVLVAALVGGALGTRLVVVPLRRVFAGAVPSRQDFVGRVAVVRTSTVTEDFGQAEVAAADGASAIISIRLAGEGNLGLGSRVVIYDYDSEGEFFWVSPLELEAEKD